MINYNIINKLEGWCSIDKCEKLYNLIIKTRPSKLVEIGVFGGKSLIVQALGLKKNNHGIIHGIDSWNRKDCINGMTKEEDIIWWNNINYEKIYNGCIEAVSRHNVEDFVKIHKITSEQYSKVIDFEIDILHIDGNHEELASCQDVNLYISKIKSGGYLWFDDAAWPQTQKAIDIIENHYKLELIDQASSDDINNFCNLYYKK